LTFCNLIMEMRNYSVLIFLVLAAAFVGCGKKPDRSESTSARTEETLEPHRPLFHFTPDSMWMNDPNGMVYFDGVYHLFYQHYPDSTVWGPMHWGHATSTDMVRWDHQPIALYPDELGYIFSGSAVVDYNNSSGFGTNDNSPLVAIFTYHNPVFEKESPLKTESQGIAFSLDKGKNWTKYNGNPVLLSPGIKDFRDPKVRWHEASERWIMTLAVTDHINFYTSPDLKNWILVSEFGKGIGAHGGVWECPDLFPMKVREGNMELWVLLVSINPGGPNGGSSTQYFIGSFDGQRFEPIDTEIRWIDYGPDNYAGVTWSNTGERTLFIGWMSNWMYANVVPTSRWRSAMTVARELTLEELEEGWSLSTLPVSELSTLFTDNQQIGRTEVQKNLNLSDKVTFPTVTYQLDMELLATHDFKFVLHNAQANRVSIVYEKASNTFTIDRSRSGDTSFSNAFGKKSKAARLSKSTEMKVKLVVDVASLELFVDHGSTVMTATYFPDQVLDQISVETEDNLTIQQLEFSLIE
jgi:fructan beta-fructosidase